ncbi:MAG TPA: family 16 glycosylhydrolase [Phycisphaerae bacterium]|nr:family 16 glycosylhydrolase [Phycisphaerae bacterium]HRY69784.1 family 16 glycosylhydrolase [Phycisphaerae bacterium]
MPVRVLWCVCWWNLVFLGGLQALAAPPSTGWPLAFGDEFDGSQIDSSKWKSGRLPWGGQHHTDQYASYITPADSYVQDGSLWLRCRKASGNEFGGYPWSEGFVYTDGIKNFTYGYVEIRARFATGQGTWPAFWMLSWGWPPEFDIAEYFGSDDRVHMGLCYGPSGTWNSSNFYNQGVGSWHSYGLEWGPGYAIWYRDGIVRKSIYAGYVPSQAMYVMLNSGMTYGFDDATPAPNYSEIDGCRIYDPPSAVVNDNTAGTGKNQFEYSGSWDYSSTQSNAFFSDNHWSSATGSVCRFRFEGSRIDLYAAKASNHGMGAVSIDGGAETMVDFYAPDRTDKMLVWASPSLGAGTHIFEMRVTGNRNAASSGSSIPVDRVDVWASSERLNGTAIGTPGSWNNAGNVFQKAFDGVPHSFFDAPEASGAWVGLDFGSGQLKRITKVRYWARPGYAARMVGGRLQGSNNASFSGAADLFTITDTPSEETANDQAIMEVSGFRYVRYLSPGGAYCNVAELEFEGHTFLPAPADLTAVPGQLRVTLTWSTSAGAAGYRVKRSTAPGGPYATLASLVETRLTDTAVQGGVTYYYVVTAVSPTTESADSIEAWARPYKHRFDFDSDADVDLADLLVFRACETGEGITDFPADCASIQFERLDIDKDGDIDQSDFGIFQRCISGFIKPADLNCAD